MDEKEIEDSQILDDSLCKNSINFSSLILKDQEKY